LQLVTFNMDRDESHEKIIIKGLDKIGIAKSFLPTFQITKMGTNIKNATFQKTNKGGRGWHWRWFSNANVKCCQTTSEHTSIVINFLYIFNLTICAIDSSSFKIKDEWICYACNFQPIPPIVQAH